MTAWLPMVLKELPLSLPIFCVGLGALIFAFPQVPGVMPHPNEELAIVERLSEFVVIVSLMGAGLKIDRPFGREAIRTLRGAGYRLGSDGG